MFNIALEIMVVLLLIVANGIFAMSELAVVSANKNRLGQLARQGNKRADAALQLADAPNRFLSTVQIGITLIGILAGAVGGATLARSLAGYLRFLPLVGEYSDVLGLLMAVSAITYLSLVIGELVPKRLALQNPERIASLVAPPMRLLSSIAFPAVYLLSVSTEVVLKVLGIRLSAEPPISEWEIMALIRQGTQAGIFKEAEQDMIESILRLDVRRASLLMTPRSEIAWLDINASPKEIQRKLIQSGHSSFPVCDGDLENVLGIVRAKDLLAQCMAGEALDLPGNLREPAYVLETTRALQVLEAFNQSKSAMLLVIDEHGSIQGLITADDILEEIAGDVIAIGEPGESQVVQRSDTSWLLDGLLSIDEFKEIFNIEALPGEEKGNFVTLGGLVITHLGRIPGPTDTFEWNGLKFEVVDMDGLRVDKVLVELTDRTARTAAPDGEGG